METIQGSPTDGDGAVRATSDELLAAIRQLVDAETRKRQTATDSPEFVRLAQVADLAGQMVARWTAAELDAASKARGLVTAGVMSGAPIETVAPRPVAKVLALWREAEYRLDSSDPGSAAGATAQADIERLRGEYQAATAAASERHARPQAFGAVTEPRDL